MIKFFFAVPLIFFVLTNIIDGQPFATRTGDKLILDNGVVQRVIQFGSADHGIVSESYLLRKTGDEFLSPDSEDFYFEADGKPVTALDKWKLLSVRIVGDENRGSGAMVVIEHPESKIRISVTYMLYPGLPLIRKKISFLNTGDQEIRLEALDIENLQFAQSAVGIDCWVLHDYARMKSLGQYTGNCYDPVVIVHEVSQHRGFVLGNEAPGVMKRTSAFLKPDQLTIGLTHPDQNLRFQEMA